MTRELLATLTLLILAAPAGAQSVNVGEEIPPSPQENRYAVALASQLGRTPIGVHGVVHKGKLVNGDTVEGRGTVVDLDGALVTRLRFRKPAEALAYLAQLVKPWRSPVIADARGDQLVLLRGPALDKPKRAASILTAAWRPELPLPKAPCSALFVASPPPKEGELPLGQVAFESATVVGKAGTTAYKAMIVRQRAARGHVEGTILRRPGEPELEVRFIDTNHFLFTATSQAGKSFVEQALTKQGGLYTVGRSRTRCRELLTYAKELTLALGIAADAGASGQAPRDFMIEILQEILKVQARELGAKKPAGGKQKGVGDSRLTGS